MAMDINESVKNQVKEIVQEMILDALENGDAAETITNMRASVKAGFNEALDLTGATENGYHCWKFTKLDAMTIRCAKCNKKVESKKDAEAERTSGKMSLSVMGGGIIMDCSEKQNEQRLVQIMRKKLNLEHFGTDQEILEWTEKTNTRESAEKEIALDDLRAKLQIEIYNALPKWLKKILSNNKSGNPETNERN